MNGPGNVSVSGELSGRSQKYKTHLTLQLNGTWDGQIKQNHKKQIYFCLKLLNIYTKKSKSHQKKNLVIQCVHSIP